jgi:hypothetical protein
MLFNAASAQETGKSKFEPITIREQGSFAVGGKVITNPGVFNPKQPTPDGQSLHGDHAYVFYQIPASPRKLPLVFLHGTGQLSRSGRPRLMVVRAFRRSFCAVVFRCI